MLTTASEVHRRASCNAAITIAHLLRGTAAVPFSFSKSGTAISLSLSYQIQEKIQIEISKLLLISIQFITASLPLRRCSIELRRCQSAVGVVAAGSAVAAAPDRDSRYHLLFPRLRLRLVPSPESAAALHHFRLKFLSQHRYACSAAAARCLGNL